MSIVPDHVSDPPPSVGDLVMIVEPFGEPIEPIIMPAGDINATPDWSECLMPMRSPVATRYLEQDISVWFHGFPFATLYAMTATRMQAMINSPKVGSYGIS